MTEHANTEGIVTGMLELLDAVRSDLRQARGGTTTWRSYELRARDGTNEGLLVEIVGGGVVARWHHRDVVSIELIGSLGKFTAAYPRLRLVLVDEGDSLLLRDKLLPRLADSLRPSVARLSRNSPNTDLLTQADVDVIRGVARGLSNKDIAEEQSLAESTIKNRLSRIFDKTGTNDRLQLVLRAADMRLIPTYGPDDVPEAA